MSNLTSQEASPEFFEMPSDTGSEAWTIRAMTWQKWNTARENLWGQGITDLSSIGPEPPRPWEEEGPPPP